MTGRFWKRISGSLAILTLSGGLLLAMPMEDVSAAAKAAELRPDIVIMIDGTERDFFSATGKELQPIVYGGTTYLPVRAIGELMGKNVDWNQDAMTLTLAGKRTTSTVNGKEDTDAKRAKVAIELRDDMIIKVDGETRKFTDANGRRVYPLLHEGATYLPLRAIGELMGKNVGWDSKTVTVSLANSLVTDADTFSGIGAGTTGDADKDLLTADEAAAYALKHAGLRKADVTFREKKLAWDDGRRIYDIEFIDGSREYDYEIDAVTGAVWEFDFDIEGYDIDDDRNDDRDDDKNATVGAADYIGKTRAGEIALAKVAGATADNIVKCELDWDDGRAVYEIEIRYKRVEYDAEIDAVTGKILSWEKDD